MANLTNFSAVIYGDLQPYNDVLSSARCRIFYKYGNRNGSYITDEFAEKLLSSIAYTPVKGIYDAVEDDYTDHGKKRYLGRIYGIVPKDYNLAWEEHEDEDGVVRTYACVDVLLFTGLYEEAKEIPNKSQSMELYAESIKGNFQYIEGKRYFVYSDGHFLGLQVLGENVEPCFEGAGFFSLRDSLKDLAEQIEKYELQSQKEEGGASMVGLQFKISDDQKFMMLWDLLNPNYGPDNDYTVEFGICDVYDQYAIVRNYAEQKFERVYYSKNDETDSLEITNREDCFIIDVNQAEKDALSALKTLNNNTYELVDEKFGKIAELEQQVEEFTTQVESLQQENSDFGAKIEEHEATIATLNQEKEEITNNFNSVSEQFNVANETISTLNQTIDELTTYKANVEKQKKLAIVNQYAGKLSDEVINSFNERVDEFTEDELEKELAFTLVKNNPSLFTNQDQNGFIPKDEGNLTGIEGILSRYKK